MCSRAFYRRSALILAAVCLASHAAAQNAADVPGAPGSFAVTVSGNNVTFSWTAVAATTPPVTAYVLTLRGNPNRYDIGLVSPYTAANVPAGTYQATLYARNAEGLGSPSSEVTFTVTTVTGTPGSPRNLRSQQIGSSVTFTWDAPSAGGTPSEYLLGVSQRDDFEGEVTLVAGAATSLTVPNAPAGEYFARPYARNGFGTSAPGTAIRFVVASTGGIPSAPLNLRVTVAGATMTLQWDAPAQGAVTAYLLDLGSTPGASDIVNDVTLGSATTFSRQVPDGSYYARVSAMNTAGHGPDSNEVMFVVSTAVQAPGTPSNLQATVTGATLTLTWSAAATGGAVLVYVLEVGRTTTGIDVFVGEIGATASLTTDQLPPGTYYLRVRARNAAGTSAPSNEVTVVIGGAQQVPGAPRSFTATVTGANLTITWQAPATGGAVVQYGLEAGSQPGLADVVTVDPVAGGNEVSATFAHRAPAGTFYLRLFARNAAGRGPSSNEVSITISGGGSVAPGPPRNFSVQGTGPVTFSWEAPNTGGTVATYVLELGSSPGAIDRHVVDVGANTVVETNQLTAGTYYARVRARNAGGTSAPSNEVQFTIQPAGVVAPGPPRNLVSSAQGATMTLSWDAPSSGGAVETYVLEIGTAPGATDIVSGQAIGPNRTLQQVVPQSGTIYVRVRARNSAGTSGPSNEVIVSIVAGG